MGLQWLISPDAFVAADVLTAGDSDAIAAQRLQLIDAGWRPIPASPIDKSCHVTGWPTIESNEFHVANWARTHLAHTLTGLVCGQRIFAVDIDVLDRERSEQIQSVAFNSFGYTPFVRIGREPKRLLVYRQHFPSSVPIRSESFRFADDSGLIEILSAGKQFIAFGMHPETGLPYRWISDANPLEDTPAEAPLVTQEQVDAFLQAVREKIAPFAVGLYGKTHPDAPRVYDAQGLVTDGRESLLRDCIFQAAHEIHRVGDALTAKTVACRGWELFAERAITTDGKWTEKDALPKASAIVRKIRDGRLNLNELKRSEQFFQAHADELEHVRDLFVQALAGLRRVVRQLLGAHPHED